MGMKDKYLFLFCQGLAAELPIVQIVLRAIKAVPNEGVARWGGAGATSATRTRRQYK